MHTNVQIEDISARKCRACGCTDLDCSQCFAASGRPCYWVKDDLCSRCALEIAENNCLSHAGNDRDTCDDLHQYMGLWNRWNWTEVVREGRRLWNSMFKDSIEHKSPKDGLIAAVAAQSADGVFAAVAAMLDLEKNDVMDLIMPWYQDQDKRPAPVSPETLADYIRDTVREREHPSPPMFTGFIGE